jgi:hypothetical protein
MATPLVSSAFKNVKVSGRNLSVNLLQNIESMSVELSNSAVSAFKLSFADTAEFNLYRSTVVNPGQTLTYEGFTFEIGELETGSGKGGPTVSLTCLSKRVTALTKQTGEKSWGLHADVSSWVNTAAKSVNFTPVVQPGLGEAEITRKKPEGGEAESTWDVMVRLKDEKGVWLFEYGNLLVFAKPTWWAKHAKAHWNYTWSTWSEHSPDLLAVPKYSRNPSAERVDREKLTLTVTGDNASAARPGDLVNLSSRLPNVGFKGAWLIASVDVGSTTRDPVTLTCLRIVDPAVRTVKPGLVIPKEMANNPAGKVAGYDQQQLTEARRIMSAAQVMKLSIHAMRVGVMTAMLESSLRNLNYGDEGQGVTNPDGSPTTSLGLFQQQGNGAWGSRSDRLNPTIAATNFFKAMLRQPGWETMDPGLLAYHVQTGGSPSAYNSRWTAAVAVVDAILAANDGSAAAAAGAAGAKAGPNPVATTAQAWINSHMGQYMDFDNAFGGQCVDVFQYYNRDVVGGPQVYGNGKDYYPQAALMGKYVRISPSSPARLGDVACWDGFYGVVNGINYGHIAVVVADNGNGTIKCFSQNPGLTRIVDLSKTGLQGYLRPKTVKPPPPPPAKAPKQGLWKYT